MTIYTTSDVLATNEGGQLAWAKRFEKEVTFDTIKRIINPTVVVAFIVDVDGSIKGERVVVDETNRVGLKMLEVAKSFKWTPAACMGRKVASLRKLKTFIDPAEE